MIATSDILDSALQETVESLGDGWFWKSWLDGQRNQTGQALAVEELRSTPARRLRYALEAMLIGEGSWCRDGRTEPDIHRRHGAEGPVS